MYALTLQTMLLGYLRTGNPIIDTLLTTMLITAVSYVLSMQTTIWAKLCYAIGRFRIKREPSVTLSSRNGEYLHSTDPQNFFVIMSYYLSKYHPPKTGHVKLGVCGGKRQLKLTPGQRHELYYNGRQLFYTWSTVKPDIPSMDKDAEELLTLSGKFDSNATILDFIEHACHTYKEDLEKKTWKQQVHFVDNKLGWQSQWSGNEKTFSSIVLPKGEKERLIKDLDTFYASETYYKSRGIPWTRGYLLHGLPGCGKTSLIKAISFMHRLDIYILNLSDIADDEQLRHCFATLPKNCALVLEDIDCMGDIAHNREQKHEKAVKPVASNPAEEIEENWKPKVTLGELLNQLDGVVNKNGRLTIMTTNHLEILDPALIRPGRIDFMMEFMACSRDEIISFWEIFLPDVPVPALSFDKAVNKLTASQVSGIMLANRNDPGAAKEALSKALFASEMNIIEM